MREVTRAAAITVDRRCRYPSCDSLVASSPLRRLRRVAARADDFVRETVPQKWIEPFVPEDLPELKYPAYFNDLDKAKFAVVHRPLQAVAADAARRYKDPKPEQLSQIALIAGDSRSRRWADWQQAIEALSDAGGRGRAARCRCARRRCWRIRASRRRRSRCSKQHLEATPGLARRALPARRRQRAARRPRSGEEGVRLVRRGAAAASWSKWQAEAGRQGVRERRERHDDRPGDRPLGDADRGVPRTTRPAQRAARTCSSRRTT